MSNSNASSNAANVISIVALRRLKSARQRDPEYQKYIDEMDKLELLEEMVKFQEKRSRVGHLTLPMMVRGRILFKALSESAETSELKLLTSSYQRHLEHELAEYLRENPQAK